MEIIEMNDRTKICIRMWKEYISPYVSEDVIDYDVHDDVRDDVHDDVHDDVPDNIHVSFVKNYAIIDLPILSVMAIASRYWDITQTDDLPYMDRYTIHRLSNELDVEGKFVRLDGMSMKDCGVCTKYRSMEDVRSMVRTSVRADTMKRYNEALYSLRSIGWIVTDDSFPSLQDIEDPVIAISPLLPIDKEIRVLVIDGRIRYMFESTNFVEERSVTISSDEYYEAIELIEEEIIPALMDTMQYTYTVDVGILADGSMMVVEFNSLVGGVTGTGPFYNIDLDKGIDDILISVGDDIINIPR